MTDELRKYPVDTPPRVPLVDRLRRLRPQLVVEIAFRRPICVFILSKSLNKAKSLDAVEAKSLRYVSSPSAFH
jgi:hypothetical protein